jgi:hypothetical protein
VVQSSCPLTDLLKNQHWPDDVITHIFECSSCGQRFKLAVETYHGSGGAWEMLAPLDPSI